MAVNSVALAIFVSLLGAPILIGAALATQVSTLWNYVLTDRLVFRGAKSRSVLHRFFGFAAVNNLVLLARLPALSWLVHLGIGYLAANLATLLVAFAVRFLVSDRYLFERGETMTNDAGARPRQQSDS
jgi:putative flippase GtrA